jgi:hypothetical protein
VTPWVLLIFVEIRINRFEGKLSEEKVTGLLFFIINRPLSDHKNYASSKLIVPSIPISVLQWWDSP